MTAAVALSVVVPTFERASILARCLAALECQTLPAQDFEVILVQDGFDRATPAEVEAARSRAHFALHYLVQEHRGPGAARNRGLEQARGDVVVFIGDDIIATPTFLASHLEAHRRDDYRGLAVLGHTTWAPWLPTSLLMAFLEENGEQFGYGLIEDPDDVPPRFFYTSNVSLKRDLLGGGPRFDEELFPWDDVDLALRLVPLGLRIVYRAEALAYHDHRTDLAAFLRRMRQVGASARRLDVKHGLDGRLERAEPMLRENRAHHLVRAALRPLAELLGWRRLAFAYYEHRGLQEFCRGYRA